MPRTCWCKMLRELLPGAFCCTCNIGKKLYTQIGLSKSHFSLKYNYCCFYTCWFKLAKLGLFERRWLVLQKWIVHRNALCNFKLKAINA